MTDRAAEAESLSDKIAEAVMSKLERAGRLLPEQQPPVPTQSTLHHTEGVARKRRALYNVCGSRPDDVLHERKEASASAVASPHVQPGRTDRAVPGQRGATEALRLLDSDSSDAESDENSIHERGQR